MRPSRSLLFLSLIAIFTLGSLLATGPTELPAPSVRAQQGHHRAHCELGFSTPDSLGIVLTATGVDIRPEIVDGTPYKHLEINNTFAYGREGAPAIPVYRTRIAIPECDQVGLKVRLANASEVSDIRPYPAPEWRRDPTTGITERRFARDESIYQTDALFPDHWAWIERVDYMRGQKIATVAVSPVRVNPVRRTATVAKRLEVTLNLAGTRGPGQVDVGPMNGILNHSLLNYSSPVAAPTKGSAIGGPLATSATGSVYWCDTPNDDWEAAADSAALVGEADYLILVADELDSALVHTLAQHRADRDAFNVSIVRLGQVDSTPDTSATPVTIRSFVKRIYDHASAAHMSDEHLGYVLLIGDAYDASNNVMLPPYYGFEAEYQKASDAYFSFLSDSTGHNDLLPDVYLGRLSVNNVSGENPDFQLSNIVAKTTSYGRPQNIGRKSLMVSGDLDQFSTWQEADNLFAETYQQYLAGGVDTSDVLHKDESDLNQYQFSESLATQISTENYWLIGMLGHGSAYSLGQTFLRPDYQSLDNDFPAVFQLTGCELGEFDHRGTACPTAASGFDECDAVAEFLTVQPKGSVGALAWARQESAPFALYTLPAFYGAIFSDNAHRLGEILVASRFRHDPADITTLRVMTLFGDPALNIMWEADTDTSEIDLAIRSEGFRVPNAVKYRYVDSGPAISLEIDVLNNWKVDADSVYLTIWEGEAVTGTQLDSVYIGSLGAYDTYTYSGSISLTQTGPVSITAAAGTVNGAADLDAENDTYSRRLYAARYESGFPCDIGAPGANSVTIADVTADYAGKELLINTAAGTSCYLTSGVRQWIVSNGLTAPDKGAPMVGHLRKVRSYEYIHRGITKLDSTQRDLLVLDAATGIPEDTISTAEWVGTTTRSHNLLLADVTSGDSGFEILLPCNRLVSPQNVDFYLDCYAQNSSQPLWTHLLGPDIVLGCEMAAGDLECDGDLEVVLRLTSPVADSLIVLDVNAAGVSRRWARAITASPKQRQGSNGLALFDRDQPGDSGYGNLEILTVGVELVSGVERTTVQLLSHTNQVLNTKYLIEGSPFFSVADVDPVDDTVELVIVAGDTIIVYSQNLLFEAGAGIDGTFLSRPLVADVLGDEKLEIVTIHETRTPITQEREVVISVFSHDLDVIEMPAAFSRPRDGSASDANLAMPALDDIDGDGVIECAFGSHDSLLHVFEIGSKRGRMPWPQYYKNPMQTNLYRQPVKGTYDVPVSLVNEVSVLGDATFDSTLYVDGTARIEVATWDATESGVDSTLTEIVVAGQSRIAGSSLSPVRFFGDPDFPDSLSWYGLRFSGSDRAHVADWLIVQNARYGVTNHDSLIVTHMRVAESEVAVTSDDHLDLRHSSIAATTYSGVEIEGGTAYLCLDTLESAGTLAGGLYVQSSSDTVECDSLLLDDSDYGVWAASGSARVHLDHSVVQNCWRGAYFAYGARALVENSLFTGNTDGVYIYSNGNVSVVDCEIDDNTTNGIYLNAHSNGHIRGNTIKDNTIGILCYDQSDPSIREHNIIKNNNAGIKCDYYSAPTVRGNEIMANTNGVAVFDHGYPYMGSSCGTSCDVDTCATEGANSFKQNTGYHISNLTAATLQAECNWWGKSTGPKPGTLYGSVDYSPYRSGDPFASSEGPGVTETAKTPSRFALHHGFPNPFNPTLRIRYDVPDPGAWVSVAVYNVRGQLVAMLVDRHVGAGEHTVTWDGESRHGTPVASGVYFVRMQAGKFTEVRKVTLLK